MEGIGASQVSAVSGVRVDDTKYAPRPGVGTLETVIPRKPTGQHEVIYNLEIAAPLSSTNPTINFISYQ